MRILKARKTSNDISGVRTIEAIVMFDNLLDEFSSTIDDLPINYSRSYCVTIKHTNRGIILAFSIDPEVKLRQNMQYGIFNSIKQHIKYNESTQFEKWKADMEQPTGSIDKNGLTQEDRATLFLIVETVWNNTTMSYSHSQNFLASIRDPDKLYKVMICFIKELNKK